MIFFPECVKIYIYIWIWNITNIMQAIKRNNLQIDWLQMHMLFVCFP